MNGAAADTVAGAADPVRAPLPPHTVLGYRLRMADALAWERRDPAEKKRRRALVAASLLGGVMLLGFTSQHLPDWLSQLHSTALAFVILLLPLGLAALVQRRDLYRRARAAVAGEVGVRLEIWDRRLAETRDDRDRPLVIGAEALRDVVETGGHVFLHARAGTIIVPVSAFADAGAMRDFARDWRAVVR